MSQQRTFLILVFTLISFTALSQEYYVVIGAFAKESNAEKFTGYANSKFLDAIYRKKTGSDLHYVVVLKTTSKEEAVARVRLLREETEFKDAWFYFGHLEHLEPVVVASPPTETIVPPPPIVVEDSVAQPEVTVQKDSTSEVLPPPLVPTEIKERPKPKGIYFKYAVVTSDGTPVSGLVHHVDRTRGRDIKSYQANEYVDVLKPVEKDGIMNIVCGVFGYKEVVTFVDYKNPGATPGAYQDAEGWVIPFQLERMSKGDNSVMYHVSFFKDAVVMQANSKTEMDELVNMMNLNPNMTIKVHGHCNGNNDRRIIALGASKNYFDIQGSDERQGSAKELSNLRAEAVRSYLMDNGIEKSRIKTYAWAGLNMLVDENSNSAKLNDRIEIEILED
jgi:outer membrane protein OmpA-like peptidoglycan-associated protein